MVQDPGQSWSTVVIIQKVEAKKPARDKMELTFSVEDEFPGVVTVYTIPACPHCQIAKQKLRELGLPFTEIDVDADVEKREEMVRLTNGARTVPQVFFNSKLIGGADALKSAVEDGRIKELVEVLRQGPDDNTPKPKAEVTAVAGGTANVDSIECEPDEFAELARAMRDPVTGLSIKDRYHYLRPFPKCFVGHECVDWLLQRVPALKTRADAVDLGQRMMNAHYFHHVCYDHGFKDAYLFYRFISEEKNNALNQTGILSSCQPLSPALLSEELRRAVLQCYDQFLSADGRAVDYTKMASSPLFTNNYVGLTPELQRVKVELLSHEEKLAFFINIYNALVVHATVVAGHPKSIWQRYRFFSKYGYIIGGLFYSLNDIEHGVLRCDRPAPTSFFSRRYFWASDPRREVSLSTLDPRVHFALVCGARGCPPIKTYKASDIDSSLTMATQSFFEDDGNLRIDPSKRVVALNSILKWYHSDFGSSDEDMLRWLLPYLSEHRAKQLQDVMASPGYSVTYLPYDWTPNSA